MKSARISSALFLALFFSAFAFSQTTQNTAVNARSARYASPGKKAHHPKKTGRKRKRSGGPSSSSKKMFSSSLFSDKGRKPLSSYAGGTSGPGDHYNVGVASPSLKE
jgi:hypothetical protein